MPTGRQAGRGAYALSTLPRVGKPSAKGVAAAAAAAAPVAVAGDTLAAGRPAVIGAAAAAASSAPRSCAGAWGGRRQFAGSPVARCHSVHVPLLRRRAGWVPVRAGSLANGSTRAAELRSAHARPKTGSKLRQAAAGKSSRNNHIRRLCASGVLGEQGLEEAMQVTGRGEPRGIATSFKHSAGDRWSSHPRQSSNARNRCPSYPSRAGDRWSSQPRQASNA
eukprot:357828-Chlamydomonas_euryale.AAC.1